MKVMLISPIKLTGLKKSKGTIPVPLLHLAAILEKHGHEPSILDFSTVKHKQDAIDYGQIQAILENAIKNSQPELFGINCFTTLHFPFTHKISQAIKSICPDKPIVIGGAHPSLFPREILQNVSTIDYIVIGEGEEQMALLANTLDRDDPSGILNIPSIAARDNDAGVKITDRLGYIGELDSLPVPAWDLISLEDYYADLSSWYNPKNLAFNACIPILTSRSCPFSCNFCACYATMGRKFRKRSPEKVVDEIQMLHEEKGQNYFGFIDDNVNLDKQHILEICNEIRKRNLNIQYETTCGTHIASLNEEVIDALADSGCVFVRLPIEHGNDRIRNEIIGKKLERKKIYSVAAYLKKRKIFTSSMFIMGFPEDTPASLEDTYNMICELKLDLNYVFNIIPFPGTRVFKQAMNDGLLIGDFDFDNLWQGLVNLDPVQDECRFFIKPYEMDIEGLMHYRRMFDKVQFFSEHAKALNPHAAED